MHRVILKMRTLAVFAVIAFAAVVHPAAAQDKAENKVVATVDGQQITESDMRLAENEIGSEITSLPPEVKRRALAEYLIDNLLFAKAAEEAKLGSTPSSTSRCAICASACCASSISRRP
jgi:peptidyl-prolyl cis-trans isomerase C